MRLTDKIENVMSAIEKQRSNSMNVMMAPKFRDCNEEISEYTIAFPIKKWQLNPIDTLHGGICSAAFDTAMGIGAAAISQGINFVTVDMFVSFIGMMKVDDTLLVKSKVLKVGSKFLRIYAEAYSEKSGSLIATANATYLFLD